MTTLLMVGVIVIGAVGMFLYAQHAERPDTRVAKKCQFCQADIFLESHPEKVRVPVIGPVWYHLLPNGKRSIVCEDRKQAHMPISEQ